MYTHKGRGEGVTFFSVGRAMGFSAEEPQEGQPPAKALSDPAKPHAGQRTEEKNLPHLGHDLASRSTSVSQLSQKNRGRRPMRLR
jgi:hypothetical protein